MTLKPPYTPRDWFVDAVRQAGYAVLAPADACLALGATSAELHALDALWDDLPPDDYLRDGGHYRRRRHSSFIVDGAAVRRVAHRAHWQPLEYNALHGGIERWYEPLAAAMVEAPVWNRLLVGLAARCTAVRGPRPWYVEAHQFRIDTTGGIGRPTPEGAHRDGVDFVCVILVARTHIKGGETRVFDAAGPAGLRFTLAEPWTFMLLDDMRVIHETTPIQPLDPAQGGHRDTLVLTFRSGGFLEPLSNS